MDYKSIVIRDTCISARGAKTAAIQYENAEKVAFNVSETPLVSPFGACSFGDELQTRRTIEWTLTPEIEQFWQNFDEWGVNYIAANSERLLRKAMTPEQVRDSYKSPVTRKEGGQFAPHLRTKINLAGPNTCRFWGEAGKRIDMVTDLRGVPCIPRVQVSHLWMMNKEFGFVLAVTDCQVKSQEEVCPF